MNMNICLLYFHPHTYNIYLKIAPVISHVNVTTLFFLGFLYVLGYRVYTLFEYFYVHVCNSFPMLTKTKEIKIL